MPLRNYSLTQSVPACSKLSSFVFIIYLVHKFGNGRTDIEHYAFCKSQLAEGQNDVRLALIRVKQSIEAVTCQSGASLVRSNYTGQSQQSAPDISLVTTLSQQYLITFTPGLSQPASDCIVQPEQFIDFYRDIDIAILSVCPSVRPLRSGLTYSYIIILLSPRCLILIKLERLGFRMVKKLRQCVKLLCFLYRIQFKIVITNPHNAPINQIR